MTLPRTPGLGVPSRLNRKVQVYSGLDLRTRRPLNCYLRLELQESLNAEATKLSPVNFSTELASELADQNLPPSLAPSLSYPSLGGSGAAFPSRATGLGSGYVSREAKHKHTRSEKILVQIVLLLLVLTSALDDCVFACVRVQREHFTCSAAPQTPRQPPH